MLPNSCLLVSTWCLFGTWWPSISIHITKILDFKGGNRSLGRAKVDVPNSIWYFDRIPILSGTWVGGSRMGILK